MGHGERAGPAPLALSQLPPLRLVERVPLSRTREIATPTEVASSGICSRIMYTPPLRPTYLSPLRHVHLSRALPPGAPT